MQNDNVIALDGVINDSTAQSLKMELLKYDGADVTLTVNSVGGDVFCANELYSLLKNYTGKITIAIIFAGSAASYLAMAGDIVKISPLGMLMLHDPTTETSGNVADLRLNINRLEVVKSGIITAYQLKTKLPRKQLDEMMSAETWLNAQSALQYGFVDEILYSDSKFLPPQNALTYQRFKIKNRAEDYAQRLASRRQFYEKVR